MGLTDENVVEPRPERTSYAYVNVTDASAIPGDNGGREDCQFSCNESDKNKVGGKEIGRESKTK